MITVNVKTVKIFNTMIEKSTVCWTNDLLTKYRKNIFRNVFTVQRSNLILTFNIVNSLVWFLKKNIPVWGN